APHRGTVQSIEPALYYLFRGGTAAPAILTAVRVLAGVTAGPLRGLWEGRDGIARAVGGLLDLAADAVLLSRNTSRCRRYCVERRPAQSAGGGRELARAVQAVQPQRGPVVSVSARGL